MGIEPEPDDPLHSIRGVGGTEVVFMRQIDYLQLDNHQIKHVEIEIGDMDYGFDINGILGMDLLTAFGAILNLKEATLICNL